MGSKHYTEAFKTKVLQAVNGGMPMSQAAKQFGTVEASIRNWKKATQVAPPRSVATVAQAETVDMVRYAYVVAENAKLKRVIADLYLKTVS